MSNGKIYLNTASCGLLSRQSVEAAQVLYEGMIEHASQAVEPLRDHGIGRIRSTVASFLQAPASQLAFIPNFSWGLNAIVQSLRGDEKVLLYTQDYPSLAAPFKINGFDITWLGDTDGFEIESEALKETLLANRIEVLAISHVQWLTGFRLDIDDIGIFCKQHKITFILDTTQSLGAVPIFPARQNIDVMICSNYKWMNAGFGTGIMYASESFMNKYPPVVGGGNAYIFSDGVSSYTPSVKNFEPGHLNMHGLLVLEKAVELKLEKGIDNIAQHNSGLLRLLLSRISPSLVLGSTDQQKRSSIVVLKDPGSLYDYLTENGIVAIKRGEHIRISFHFYNTQEEVETLVALLNAFAA